MAFLLSPLQWSGLGGSQTNTTITINYATAVTLNDTDVAPWSVDYAGTPATVNSVSQPNSTELNLEMASTPPADSTITVSYAPPPYTVTRDSDGAQQTDQTGTFTTAP